jgi:hypothetical protein
MEPLLLIAGLTALHLAVFALIDGLGSSKPWPWKLGWGLVILGAPLIGPALYFLRAERQAKRPRPRRAPPGGVKDETEHRSEQARGASGGEHER